VSNTTPVKPIAAPFAVNGRITRPSRESCTWSAPLVAHAIVPFIPRTGVLGLAVSDVIRG